MRSIFTKISLLANGLVNYKISLKELYFSFSTWFFSLILFLGFATKFHSSLWLINLAIALIIYIVILFTTNRILLSGFLTLLMAVSFDYIKNIKWQFLMQDFSAADFFMIKLLINHGLLRLIYEYATREIYLILFLMLVNFILLWNKSDRLVNKHDVGVQNYYIVRLLSIIVAVILSYKIVEKASDKRSYISHGINSVKNDYKAYYYKFYGPFADVLFTMQDMYIHPRRGNTPPDFITNIVKNDVMTALPPLEEMPDIVVILNESVFNPSKLDYDFADNFQYKFFEGTDKVKYSGNLNVHTFGGSSWISEYEINTGITHQSFSGPSYMPFIALAPVTKNSIMAYLRSIGYRIEVVYPVDKNFSLANDAYKQLGAHRVQDIFDFGFNPKTWANIPDSIIGDMIIKALEENQNKPKYIFASTMLNHGPHSSFTADNIGCTLKMNDKLCSKLNDYLSRLNHTNKEQMELIEKLMKRKRKTIVVNFGDHMPSFEGYSTQLRFVREIDDYYKTFYNIHANFDLPAKVKTKYKNLDISLIPGLLLDIAGVNHSDFYRANSLIRQKCAGKLSKCQLDKNEQKILESYKSLVTEQLHYSH